MAKFVASIVEVPGAVNITMEEFGKSIKEVGGLQSAIELYVGQAVEDFREESEIFFVNDALDVAENMVTVLNQKFNERAEAQETPSYVFSGASGEVAYGNEVIASGDTAETAINNIINHSTKNQTKESKGDDVQMTNVNIKNVVANLTGAGTTDADALAIAEKFRQAHSAKMKNAATTTTQKEETEMKNNRKGTVAPPAAGGFQRFGSVEGQKEEIKEETKGGNDMTNERKTGGSTVTEEKGGNTWSYNGPTADTSGESDASQTRTGYDETSREGNRFVALDRPWYLDAKTYPILEDFLFYFNNRLAIPTNPYGITEIKFLDAKKKSNIFQQPNNYTTVVEVSFGKGINIRFRTTRITEKSKAESKAKWGTTVLDDLSSGNISKVKHRDTGKWEKKYTFVTRNELLVSVVCSCGRKHDVSTERETTCLNFKCNKVHGILDIQVSGGVKLADKQTQWQPVVLDNYNIIVHQDILALAMAAAQYQYFLPMHGIVPEEEGQA